MIRCISPIDGSVYAERPALTPAQAADAAANSRQSAHSHNRSFVFFIIIIVCGVIEFSSI